MIDRLWSELRYRWRALFSRDHVEHELDDELAFHLEQEARKLEARGLSREAAARAARVAFGGAEAVKDDVRDVRGTIWLEQLWADLRQTARALAAQRAFTLGVVGTLALGLGANVTVFGIVDRLLFRTPTGLQHEDRVHRVHLTFTVDGRRRTERSAQYPRLVDLARDTRTFDRVAGFQVRNAAIGDGEDTREGAIATVTASYLDFFEAPPVLGRWFTAAEDIAPEGAPVAVLSHAYWLARYGGRPDVLGQSLRIDRLEAMIIGVAPPGFTGITDNRLPLAFVPLTAIAYAARSTSYVTSYNWSWLELFVRRAPGISVAEATTDLTEAYRRSWSAENASRTRAADVATADPVTTLGPVHLGRGPNARLEARVALWMVAVAAIVFLVACANVANLFLARAIGRQREVAMRLALGVGRARLARQFVLESLVLGVLGSIAGIVLSAVAGGVLRALLLPAGTAVPVVSDPRTILFSVALAIAAGVLTALVPAWTATRQDVVGVLRSGGRGATRPRTRTQAMLVVAQAALSVLLLVGAAAFLLSFQRAVGHRLGLDVDRLLYADVNLRGTRIADADATALTRRIEETARSVPGVVVTTTAASVPFWTNEGRRLRVTGIDDVHQLGRFTLQAGSTDYFTTTGTRILRGRGFSTADGPDGAPIVVVSDAMARTLWPGREALGECLRVSDGPPGTPRSEEPCRTVVGIAEESAMTSLEPAREFTYYLPVAQFPAALSPQYFIRVDGSPAALAATLRARLQPLLPGAAYVAVVPFADVIAPQYRAWRSGATVFAAFGLLALALAALGLYSLVAYEVVQRRQEFGVRVAIGASRRQVLQLVLGRGVRLVGAGIGIGLALAWVVSRPLDSLLFHQSSRDPAVWAGVAIALALAAALASLLPGWRASLADPTEALRAE